MFVHYFVIRLITLNSSGHELIFLLLLQAQTSANRELFDALSVQNKKVKALIQANQEKDAIVASLEDEKAKNAGEPF